jgi:ureidoacrylate peracid hydrolase
MSSKTKVDPDVCTIVVVDMQNDFCHCDGKSAQNGADTTPMYDMVPRMRALLTRARELQIPVVWIQTYRNDWTNSTVWLARHSLYVDPPVDQQRGEKCLEGTWGAEFFEVAPEPGEPIVNKVRHNAFTGTNLEPVLRTIGRPSVVFTGVATNVCVDSTLRDALFREFHVAMIEDCCAGTSPDAHDATVDNVRKRFGPVLTTEEALKIWQDAG